MDVDFDCPLFSSDTEGFYFFVPRRFAWTDLCNVIQKHIDDFQYIPVDEWKLKSDNEEIIYRKG